MDMYDRRHCAPTKNRFGVLGDRFETEISYCFNEYTSNCTELLREYGAEGNAKERLQWMIQNMDTTIVQMTEFEHPDGTSMTTIKVSHSRVPNNRGYGLVIKRADGTAHLLCKEYNGTTNNKNVGHEFASRHYCDVEEVYTFIGNIYYTTWGYNEQRWTEITADEQQLVLEDLMKHSTVGSGREAEVKVKVEVRRMTTKEDNFVMTAGNDEMEARQETVLIPPVNERIAARNLLIRWHILIQDLSNLIPMEGTKVDSNHNPQDKVNTFKYTVSRTLHNVLGDVKKRGGEQQALALLAFTIYCRNAIADKPEATAVLRMTWELISEMIRLHDQGKFKHNDVIQSEVILTESVTLSRIREALEVASAHILHCAGSSEDTKWTGLISDMELNDHSELRFQTDRASEDWLPAMYVPLDSVINNNIGEVYKIKLTNSNSQLSRFIGQYWSLGIQPWVEPTGSIPHDRIPAPTGQQETVFGQSYMNDGSYVSARTKQLTPIESMAGKSITVPKNLMKEIHNTERMQNSGDNQAIMINDSPLQTRKAVTDIREALHSPSSELRAYWKQQGDQNVSQRAQSASRSPRILAGNDTQSQPGSVRQVIKQMKGFTRASSDSPTVGQLMITVYFSYHMKPKPKARIARSIPIVSPMNNIRS